MPTLSPKSSDNEESVAIQAPAAKLDKIPFYEGAERGRMRDLILQLIEDSEEALLLTGQSGIGKTALLQQILRGAPKSWRLCQINATASLGVPALFHKIIAQLELVPPPNKQLNTPLIAELLLQVRASGVLPVMVIDDIQLLNDEVLDALLTLSHKSKTDVLCPLKLLMSGSLAKDGQAAKHAKRLEAMGGLRTFVLMPLRREQSKEFVEQCCLPDGAVLSQALTDVIYDRSDG
ncbi:AAA family ATPase, partial [Pseudomonadota bacterium]